MLAIVLILFFAFLAFRSADHSDDEIDELPTRVTSKLGQLWDIAHQGMRENRFFAC